MQIRKTFFSRASRWALLLGLFVGRNWYGQFDKLGRIAYGLFCKLEDGALLLVHLIWRHWIRYILGRHCLQAILGDGNYGLFRKGFGMLCLWVIFEGRTLVMSYFVNMLYRLFHKLGDGIIYGLFHQFEVGLGVLLPSCFINLVGLWIWAIWVEFWSVLLKSHLGEELFTGYFGNIFFGALLLVYVINTLKGYFINMEWSVHSLFFEEVITHGLFGILGWALLLVYFGGHFSWVIL